MIIKVNYTVSDVYMSTSISPVYIKVVYSGVSGGGGTWGTITGTLSDQTDLQDALDDKFDDPTGTTAQYLRGDGSLATFPTIPSGTVTSVGLTMPSAFGVANSPITSSGTLAVTALGSASQYIRGDGVLATLPTGGSGGSSVSYYLNGGTAASVGTYFQMSTTAVIGTNADFTRTGNGLISQFLTDVGDPNRLQIPAGNWNFEMFFSMSSSGGNTAFYVELLKYDGTTFTSITSSTLIPEEITGGTNIDLYLTSLAIPATTLLVTDRLALRVYIVNNSGGRTATLHTQDSHLCQIITNFAGGVSALNGLTANTQYFATGTSGTDFGISSVSDTHTFNLPTASATNRGALSSADWTTFNSKQAALTLTTTGTSGAATLVGATLNIPQYSGGGGGSMAIGGAITSATAGSVLFAGASGVLQQDNTGLFWDDTNNRLGIGTNTPIKALQVNYSNNTYDVGFAIKNTNTGVNALTALALLDTSDNIVTTLTYFPNTFVNTSLRNSVVFNTTGLQKLGFLANAGNVSSTAQDIYFQTLLNKFNIYLYGASGNVVIQNGGTFADAGYRLDVQGTARINSTVSGDVFTINGNNTNTFKYNATTGGSILSVAGPTAAGGAYFLASGYAESWFNVVATQATSGNRYWRFGNQGTNNYFAIQKLNDAASAITGTPLTIFSSTGNALFQAFGSSTTDGGFPLQVIGNARVSANMLLGATTTVPSRQTDSTTYPGIFVGNSNSSVMGETTSSYKGIIINANVVRNSSLYWVAQDTTKAAWSFILSYEQDNLNIIRYASGQSGTLTIGASMFFINAAGNIALGNNNTPTAQADISASTTARASLRIRSGTAPTSPNDGDIWFDGTDLKMRIGGVTKTFTLI